MVTKYIKKHPYRGRERNFKRHYVTFEVERPAKFTRSKQKFRVYNEEQMIENGRDFPALTPIHAIDQDCDSTEEQISAAVVLGSRAVRRTFQQPQQPTQQKQRRQAK